VTELTLDDLLRSGPRLRRFLPVAVKEVWVLGSAGVASLFPQIPASLRTSRDIDIAPIGVPRLYLDEKIIDRELGEDSAFAAENLFFVDYVTPDLLRCTPVGWQDRVTMIELAPGLSGHFLEAHDIAYNKLWAGREKDIKWVRGLLDVGVITMGRLRDLHVANPIPAEDRAKVDQSLAAVSAAPGYLLPL
jgi:hypothetical protein